MASPTSALPSCQVICHTLAGQRLVCIMVGTSHVYPVCGAGLMLAAEANRSLVLPDFLLNGMMA
jgi:hypothetical protein